MGKLASLMAMFPIHPGCTANVAEAPGAIVPGTIGAPALVGVPSVSSCAVEMAAVCMFKMVKVRSPGTGASAGGGADTIAGAVGAGATGVLIGEGMVMTGALPALGARLIPRASSWLTAELLAAEVVVEVDELLVDTWIKTASRVVVDVDDVDVDVGGTGDPSW